jgi:hypothetical protein
MTHPFWINAGARNVRETTDHGAQRFHPRRPRKSWVNRNSDCIFVVVIIALVIVYNVT